jgi:hypothetical protein
MNSALAEIRVQTFDSAPVYAEPQPAVPLPGQGEWGVQQDGLDNIGVDEFGDPVIEHPFWHSGGGGGSGGSNGWVEAVGRETPLDHLDPVGPNFAGLPNGAIKTSVFTAALFSDETSWGDVSTATHVTMDVKGSFAEAGGISVFVCGGDGVNGGCFWSWSASANAIAVGNNPGNVTEWTTITIPINKPTHENYDQLPIDPEASGSWGPDPFGNSPGFPGGGNWGRAYEAYGCGYGNFCAPLVADWDATFANVTGIDVRGLTPDSQIDNLGFILPDVGTPGDFNDDTFVNAADYVLWRNDPAAYGGNPAGYNTWRANFGAGSGSGLGSGAVPEPTMLAMAMIAGFFGSIGSQRRR